MSAAKNLLLNGGPPVGRLAVLGHVFVHANGNVVVGNSALLYLHAVRLHDGD